MLVVLDSISKLVVDIFPIEDGHAQERSRFKEVLAVVKPNQIWTGDRNFCTAEFLTTIADRKAFFVIRQHGSLGWKEISELKAQGQTETGDIFEQEVEICFQGQPLRCRRVVVKLFKPTRDKELEIAILTNLSPQVADTAKVAQLYRDRWSVETLFQTVTANFNGEIQTLAYPRAALFSLAMAFATYNILATIRAVLGTVHGVGKVEAGLSDYYLVDEIQGTYRGMMISIPAPHWQVFETFDLTQMGLVLQHLAQYVHLNRFLKATRGEKKKRPPLIVNPHHRHVSTARLLQTHQTPVNAGFQQ
jgi:Transposase DDE domain